MKEQKVMKHLNTLNFVRNLTNQRYNSFNGDHVTMLILQEFTGSDRYASIIAEATIALHF